MMLLLMSSRFTSNLPVLTPVERIRYSVDLLRRLWYIVNGITTVWGPDNQARSQHFYKGGHDDGGTEGTDRGAEARSVGAPRGWSLGRGAVTPRKFSKNQRWNCTFSNVWRVTPVAKQSSVCNSGANFFNPWRGDIHPCPPSGYAPVGNFDKNA